MWERSCSGGGGGGLEPRKRNRQDGGCKSNKQEAVFQALQARCVSERWSDLQIMTRGLIKGRCLPARRRYGLLWPCISECLCFIIKIFTERERRAAKAASYPQKKMIRVLF